MRQKEVMGQSIRTSKSARPGTITYVPIDKSEFRSTDVPWQPQPFLPKPHTPAGYSLTGNS